MCVTKGIKGNHLIKRFEGRNINFRLLCNTIFRKEIEKESRLLYSWCLTLDLVNPFLI